MPNETKLLQFVAAFLGVPNTGDNAQNAGQCVGLVERWLDECELPHIYGNAKDLLTNAGGKPYKVTKNSPTNFPPAGAIVVWGSTWGGGYGHTAVVLAATKNFIAVFEQNDPTGSYPIVATHNYSGVVGWITW